MALLPSPAALRRALGRGVTDVTRRLLRIQQTPPGEALTKVPDDLPRDMLFTQPLVCEASVAGDPEPHADGTHTVAFKVVVKDATGRRCPDLFVEATLTGPKRTATGDTTTSLLGAATFKMNGPAGDYAIEVRNVAAHALDWDQSASTTTAVASVG